MENCSNELSWNGTVGCVVLMGSMLIISLLLVLLPMSVFQDDDILYINILLYPLYVLLSYLFLDNSGTDSKAAFFESITGKSAAVCDEGTNKESLPWVAKKLKGKAFVVVGFLSLAYLGYCLFGVYRNYFVLAPFPMPLYGYSAVLCLTAMLCISVNISSVTICQYLGFLDTRRLRGFRRVTRIIGILLLFATLAASIYQRLTDIICENRMIERVVCPNKAISAVSYLRYCEFFEPSRDCDPSLMITVFNEYENLEKLPRQHIVMNGGRVERLYWQDSKLVVEYRIPSALKWENGVMPEVPNGMPVDYELIDMDRKRQQKK